MILATGILLGASIVLAELASIGSRQASAARDLAQSQLLCQTRLNEIVAGIEPMVGVQDTPLADAPSEIILKAPMSPVRRTCVPPQSSRE